MDPEQARLIPFTQRFLSEGNNGTVYCYGHELRGLLCPGGKGRKSCARRDQLLGEPADQLHGSGGHRQRLGHRQGSAGGVRAYDLETLRNQVAVVLQKNVLFSGTIKENLRWGDPNATDAELQRACELACADEFIQQMPDKYDTYIEQGGSNVSGGQKQRLCIARALLKKPKILILDDSTSAVDTKTDAKIRAALRTEIPETTKFIIAQRISSIQDADLILVLDGGAINGMGTHETLLSSNQIYQEVYYSQNRTGGADNG